MRALKHTPIALAALLALGSGAAFAQPAPTQLPVLRPGGAIVNATVGTPANNALTVTQTASSNNRALVEWSSFSIGSQARVNIVQPNTQSVLVNRVVAGPNGASASEIYGAMSANGRVFLVNPAGVLFGPGAQVNVGSLVATSLDLDPTMTANNYDRLINGQEVLLTQSANGSGQTGIQVLAATDPRRPQIEVSENGSILLISHDQVVQDGSISAPRGQVNITTSTSATLLPVGTSGFVEVLTAQPAESRTGGVALGFNSQTLASGGSIVIGGQPKDELARSDSISIAGVVSTDSATGPAGSIHIDAGTGGTVFASEGAVVTASSTAVGGTGGQITVLGEGITLQRGDIANPRILAEGTSGGGRIELGNASTRALFIDQATLLSADATDAGNGGSIAVRAMFNNPSAIEPVARFDYGVTEVYGTLRSRGGTRSGNGGSIETSGMAMTTSLTDGSNSTTQSATIDASARAAGGAAGAWTLDPYDVTISNAGPVAVDGTFNPTGPGANVRASDLSAALDAGTNIDISTEAGGAGTAAGNISIATGTTITRSTGTAATSLTLRANNNILVDGAIIDASSAGPVNVNLYSDLDGNGSGSIVVQGSRILTSGGNLTLSGGAAPATGYARGDGQNAAITVLGGTLDTRGGAGAGNVVMRGQAATGSTLNGVNLGADLFVGNLNVEGLTSHGTGVSLNGSSITTTAGNIDVRGMALRTSATTALPTGVNTGTLRVQLGTGSMTLAGRGDDANLAGSSGNATGLLLGDLLLSADATSTGRITLAGQATGGSLGSGVAGTVGSNAGLVISSNAQAAGSPATGANIVIGGASDAPTAALSLTSLNVNTSGSVNLRPLGVSASGAITEQRATAIYLASPTTDATAAGLTINTDWLIAPAVDANGGMAAGQGFVVGSAEHTGAITVYDDVFTQHSGVALTLQNEGAGAQGITFGGGNQLSTLGLLTAGNVIQGAAGITTQNLVIRGGAASDVTLASANNLIGVLAFDPPNAITVLAQGNLTVDAASVQTFGAGGFTPLAITSSVGGNTVRLQAPEVNINQSISMAGTGATVLDIVSTDSEFGVTFAPETTLTTGAAGRWRVWSDRIVNAPTTGPTTNLYGCPYTSGSTCSVSGITISPNGNQFLSSTQPTLTVTANPATGFISLPTPALTYTVAGLQNGDTAASALSGTLGTTQVTPTTLDINIGNLFSPQGYLIDFVPSTLRLNIANLDVLGVSRHMLQAGFRAENSSDVYGNNLDQPYICTAASVIRGSLTDSALADPLASEWGKVRNQPQLSGCLNVTDGGSCSAF